MIFLNKKISMQILIVLGLFALCNSSIYALETDTHEVLNEYIARNALNNFFLGSYLKNQLGIQNEVDELVNNQKVWQWFRDGGLKEDKPYWYMPYLRSVNHFHNPLTQQGFSGIWGTEILFGQSSIHWSQSSIGTQYPGGHYSWYDVRDYFYKALIEVDNTIRDINYAETFRGLGQLMHLVEDMSVPEHTRDDGHYFFYNYEVWVNDTGTDRFPNVGIDPAAGIVRVRNSDLQSFTIITPVFYDSSALGTSNPIAPVPFANLFDTRQYIGTNPDITLQNNIGLSEYTNANFLSPDSMFTIEFSNPALPGVIDYDEVVDVNSGEKTTYIKKIGFTEGGNGESINHLAVGRWFYKYLPSILKNRGLTFDDRVYSDYAQKLMPRAVGYSAGLLNYFFRGTLEITPPAQVAYAVTDGSITYYDDTTGNYHQAFSIIKANIRNSTPDTILGEEVHNCDQIQGNCIIQAIARYKIIPNYMYDLSNYSPDGSAMHDIGYSYSVSAPITITSLSSADSTEFTFNFSAKPIPAGITDLYLQVVFKGTLGNEPDIAVAVGIKDLMEPTHQVFWNATDMFQLDGHLYVSDSIRNDSQLSDMVDFDDDGTLNETDIGEPYIDPHPVTFGIGYLNGPPGQSNPFTYSAITTVQPGRYIRVIALFDKAVDNYMVLEKNDSIDTETQYFHFVVPGVVNQEVDGVWQTPTPITTFRYGLDIDGITQIPIIQHFKTGFFRCYPVEGADPDGNPSCSYSESEAIPGDLLPSTIETVYFP